MNNVGGGGGGACSPPVVSKCLGEAATFLQFCVQIIAFQNLNLRYQTISSLTSSSRINACE